MFILVFLKLKLSFYQYLKLETFQNVPSHHLTKLPFFENLAISAVFTLQLWFSFHIRPSARHGLKFISGRHMRSKRRCSCVLQFTRLHAVSCVLHRPTSQVIHHSRLIFSSFFVCLYIFFTSSCLVYIFFTSSKTVNPQVETQCFQCSPHLIPFF